MQPLQIVSVITIIRCQEKFLLVQRGSNDDIFPKKWQNLGGKIEIGETVESAIKREIKEEIGIELDIRPTFLLSYTWKKDEDSPTRLGLIFLMKLKGDPKKYRITLNSELSDFKWVSFNTAKKMNNENKLIGKDSPTGTFGQISFLLN